MHGELRRRRPKQPAPDRRPPTPTPTGTSPAPPRGLCPRWSAPRSRGPRTSLTSSLNPSNYSQSVTFTAKVSASSGTPTGTVTFYSCGASAACGTTTSLGTGTLSGGKAILATSSLPVGTTYIEAVYGGSGTYSGSTSTALGQVVKAIASSTSLTSSPNPSNFGQSVTFTATVGGSGTPGGSVTFYSCTTTLVALDLHRVRDTQFGQGHHCHLGATVGDTLHRGRLRASGNYLGFDLNGVAPGGQGRLSPLRPLTSSPNPSTPGPSVTFTATVSASRARRGGTVTFYSCTPRHRGYGLARHRDLALGPGHHLHSTASQSAPPTSRPSTRLRATSSGSTSNVVAQVVIVVPGVWLGVTMAATSSANPSSRSSPGPTATTSSTPSAPATGSTASVAMTASTLAMGTTSSPRVMGTMVSALEMVQCRRPRQRQRQGEPRQRL